MPSLLNAAVIVKPDTIVRWHRMGFRLYWRWKSRSRGGRPQIPVEVRSLIRRMNLENPLWGAPRIHAEMLKLDYEVAQSTVAFSRWASPTIRPLSGSPGRLPRHSLGMKHPPISFETVSVLTAVPSPIVSRQWAFVITRLRLAHPGKMGMRKG
jgi:hypothetical protein